MSQQNLDTKNAEFWNELCGSGLARSLGITEASPESLRRFDDAYMNLYPYLTGYVIGEDLRRKTVLEIGLGYGTFGQFLASRGGYYHGLDIAEAPVAMMRYRLDQLGQDSRETVRMGSALEIPYSNEAFQYVYSIGCLHHTGNLKQAVREVHRILTPGGKAIIMLYNRHSFRQLTKVSFEHLRTLFSSESRINLDRRVRGFYDTNASGEAAPHTDYVSRREAKRLFSQFSNVTIDVQNFDAYVLFGGRLILRREQFLKTLARVVGLDLYITATK